MANILTYFARVYAQPDHRIDRNEADRMIDYMINADGLRIGRRGSYHVPVHVRIGSEGRYLDVQHGNGVGLIEFIDHYFDPARYLATWERVNPGNGDPDRIVRLDLETEDDGECRYGFDEVRITTAGEQPPRCGPDGLWRPHDRHTWIASITGGYLASNERGAEGGHSATVTTPHRPPGPFDLITPTTPCYQSDLLTAIDPPWLQTAACGEDPDVVRIQFRWRGRLVHQAQPEWAEYFGLQWEAHAADYWDNCRHPQFLHFADSIGLPTSDEAYHTDHRH
ncbi:hypothetical protein OHB12_22160 [Nocardia sp. NBC_01730]|uniref:hypothetical protein n=1 Tax=Nocardia sp. NBC_01730 TaxID=2975998 RepID=UPI002E105086|nr:hypothetical protein OHB12_22160 [Nocardia sp. NBC_01730]